MSLTNRAFLASATPLDWRRQNEVGHDVPISNTDVPISNTVEFGKSQEDSPLV
jgi:hypothetical protein